MPFIHQGTFSVNVINQFYMKYANSFFAAINSFSFPIFILLSENVLKYLIKINNLPICEIQKKSTKPQENGYVIIVRCQKYIV